ncbi:MAG: 30S ribosomal protein S6 [Synergistaceae bacterium]|jgi:ribosomal protein S6|nr:30S ribosomal protein S6 [Synergistaceae bacterium]
MRRYEMLVLMDPDVGDMAEETGKIREIIGGLGGSEDAYSDVLGRRRLAYPVRKGNQFPEKSEGIYVLFRFGLEPSQTFELKRVLGLRPNVIRQMLILKDE